jgi:hypothetical protein
VPIVAVFAESVAEEVHTVCDVPALAAVGLASLTTVTVLLDEGHVPLEIVHIKLFAPVLSPLTPVVGEEALDSVAVPVLTDQSPVPVVGVFPDNVTEEAQSVCNVPALAVAGFKSRMIVTVLIELGHVPFETVHTKLFAPLLNPLTPLPGEEGFEIVAVPVATVQSPVPVVGVLAPSVAEEVHKVCEVPALAVVGFTSLITVTVLLDEGQVPLEIVHTKLFVPVLSPVTPLVDEEGVVIVVVPLATDQSPVPVVGVFPVIVAEEAQSVCDVPALDTVGFTSLITVTVLLEERQVPLEIVHIKRLIPILKPLTEVFVADGLAIVAVPVATVQSPVPVVGVLAPSVAEEVHRVCEVPALAVVGFASFVTVTVLLDEGQVPLEIVHTKLLTPVLSPVTPLVDEEGLVTVAVPLPTDQSPVPVVGVLAASVAEEAQSV